MARALSLLRLKMGREHNVDVRKLMLSYGAIPVGVFAIRFALHPLSVVKTHLQVQESRVPQNWRQTVSTVALIRRQEGLRGFYRGFVVGSASMIVGPVYAASMDMIKIMGRRFQEEHKIMKNEKLYYNIICPAVAGTVASILWQSMVVPIDIVSQIQMIQRKRLSGEVPQSISLTTRTMNVIEVPADYSFRDIVKHVYRHEGLSGFYRGFGVSLAMYIPASAIVWSTYESVRDRQKGSKGIFSHDVVGIPSAGFVAGVTSGVLTNPIDVIRTRIQLNADHREARIGKTVRRMMRVEGLSGFTAGMVVRTLSHGPKVAGITALYELVQYMSRKAD